MTCEECTNGIMEDIEQLLSEPFVFEMVDALSGEGFCRTEEDIELCDCSIDTCCPTSTSTWNG